jgi:hypothetical protein
VADVEREEWMRARRALRGQPLRVSPTIESCELVPRVGGGFDIVIRGQRLRSGPVPPHILVGDRPARSVQVTDGTVLRGVVDAGSVGDEVLIDLGPGGRTSRRVDTVGRAA